MATKFTALHYNAIAKDFRETFIEPKSEDSVFALELIDTHNAGLSKLLIKLCVRFSKDNSSFNALKFMKAAIPESIQARMIERATR